MRYRAARYALGVFALAATVLVACTGDEATSTPTASPTSTPIVLPTSPGGTIESVRDIDFTAIELVGPIIDHFSGGELELRRTVFTDVTGDGVEEAVLIVESGGTQGDLGAAVLTVVDGAPAILGFVDGGGRVEVGFQGRGGLIVSRQGIWETGDAECCPSKLREQFYEWDGAAFEVTVDQVVDNPDL